ncbi:MAG: uroporphyrinogen-III C-methyltransferase [Planctomycetota bacterium]|jgi:uroporphyrinogen III methyltransferase/synthase
MTGSSAIVIAAHGAGDGSPANALAWRIARAVAARTGRPALPAFVRGTPALGDVLARLAAPAVTVVPLLTSDGYVARRLPALLDPAGTAGVRLAIRPPIGAHPLLRERIVHRVVEACAGFPAAPAVIVVGHGTGRSATSGDRTRAVAAAIRRATRAEVRCAFLDQSPRLERVAARIERAHLVVVPLLIGGGGHARRDVGERLRAGLARRGAAPDTVILPPVGDDPGLLEELVLDVLDGAEGLSAPAARPARRTRPAAAGSPMGGVHLVGAGPGDPELITVRGLALLRAADVVVHDRLIGPELLDEVRAEAILVDVGKAPGRHRASQAQINDMLVAHARAGRCVVRLKGGDPLLFGRGWEELTACRAHGVTCEIVPGVSSALAAPAAAGIPVTVRGVASSLAIVTPRAEGGAPDAAVLAKLDTVCVLMGRADLPALAADLQRAGRDPATPAAAVERGTMAGQRTVVGTLASIAGDAAAAGLRSPVVVVIGAVAGLAAGDAGPLRGRRVVVTRPRRAARPIVARLRRLGAEVIEAPLIRIAYRDPGCRPEEVADCRWLAFASRHGVIGFRRWLDGAGRDARAVAGMRIAAVGPSTAAELSRIGLRADVVAAPHRAAALAELLVAGQASRPGPVLLPGGRRAGPELANALTGRGVAVRPLRVCDTLPRRLDAAIAAPIRQGADVVLLHSPTAVAGYTRSGLPRTGPVFACIGRATADAARANGLGSTAVPADRSDEGLVALVLAHAAAVAAT